MGMRMLAAVGVLVSAAVHLWLWFDGYRDIEVIGPAFLLNAVAGTVIGGVVVAPRASELIFPLALAVTKKLHVDDVANTFTVYPSLTGSISEAARRLHVH